MIGIHELSGISGVKRQPRWRTIGKEIFGVG